MEADAEAVAVANELTHKKCWNKMKRLKKKIYIKDNDFCVCECVCSRLFDSIFFFASVGILNEHFVFLLITFYRRFTLILAVVGVLEQKKNLVPSI